MGIGTETPDARLEIASTWSAKLLLSGGTYNNIYFNDLVGTDRAYIGYLNNTDRLFLVTAGNAPVEFYTNSTLRMTILGDGKFGIGTAAPAELLDVAGTTQTKVLKITGGADLAEPFVIASTDVILPGSVVSIDPAHPGQLRVASSAYDRTVAGIISGAGGVKPGILLTQTGSEADGDYPVALTGRVYAWADAAGGPIIPGDLLTTSDTPGHVMKVNDHTRAQGAVIGKAMSSLDEGRGLVLVLVALQ